jgi:hypothetical protein
MRRRTILILIQLLFLNCRGFPGFLRLIVFYLLKIQKSDNTYTPIIISSCMMFSTITILLQFLGICLPIYLAEVATIINNNIRGCWFGGFLAEGTLYYHHHHHHHDSRFVIIIISIIAFTSARSHKQTLTNSQQISFIFFCRIKKKK